MSRFHPWIHWKLTHENDGWQTIGRLRFEIVLLEYSSLLCRTTNGDMDIRRPQRDFLSLKQQTIQGSAMVSWFSFFRGMKLLSSRLGLWQRRSRHELAEKPGFYGVPLDLGHPPVSWTWDLGHKGGPSLYILFHTCSTILSGMWLDRMALVLHYAPPNHEISNHLHLSMKKDVWKPARAVSGGGWRPVMIRLQCGSFLTTKQFGRHKLFWTWTCSLEQHQKKNPSEVNHPVEGKILASLGCLMWI